MVDMESLKGSATSVTVRLCLWTRFILTRAWNKNRKIVALAITILLCKKFLGVVIHGDSIRQKGTTTTEIY